MTVARLRLARTGPPWAAPWGAVLAGPLGGHAGSPREPPSLNAFAPLQPHLAAPAMSVAAAETSGIASESL
jgi:hypothetical protein